MISVPKLAGAAFLLWSLHAYAQVEQGVEVPHGATEAEKTKQANSQLDAQIVRTRNLIAELQRLKPEDIRTMDRDDATNLVIEYGNATIPLAYLAIAAGRVRDPAKFQEFFRAEKLEALGSPELQKKIELVGARGDPVRITQASEGLQKRYPAYDAYVKRNRVKSVLNALRKPAHALEERVAAKQDFAALGSDDLREVSHATGVRSASYGKGVFHIVLDEAIVDGAVLELTMRPLGDGKVSWGCSSTEAVRKYVPEQCRH